MGKSLDALFRCVDTVSVDLSLVLHYMLRVDKLILHYNMHWVLILRCR